MERKVKERAAELEQLRGAALAASLQKIQDKLNLQQKIQDTPGELTVRYPEGMFHVKPAGPPPRGATTPDPGVPAVAREVFMQMIEQSPEFRRRVLDILRRPFATENWLAKTDVPRCRWAAHASAFTGQCGHFHRYVAGAPPKICPKCKNGVQLDFAVDTGIDAQQNTEVKPG
jgi:hypothetical protein